MHFITRDGVSKQQSIQLYGLISPGLGSMCDCSGDSERCHGTMIAITRRRIGNTKIRLVVRSKCCRATHW
ncbi:hypothetical protein PILCRDRAFT_335771 [Piloderma croceum F 1598]|uniref:Uncharacterized protein n=1 Tax=Piloderma croceum (strain F 1598) TaxID=765440 RepID=A0A0C3G2T8_PILCF|nr:hypothetical protein PILCRDRAFT_335771 [Piloderma croceum F 1598]